MKVRKEIALRDASCDEMEKSEEIFRRAKQSQRDAERMRSEDEAQGRALKRETDSDTTSEIDLARHRGLMHD